MKRESRGRPIILRLVNERMISSRCSTRHHKRCENMSKECQCKCHDKIIG
jgi:hypothetical protein